MNKITNQQLNVESSQKDLNYLLNMQILSSLKSLPCKVVNLEQQNYKLNQMFSNENNISKKLTTSSTITKDFFSDLEELNLQRKYYTTGSVFKPIAQYPIKNNMNLTYHNSLMNYAPPINIFYPVFISNPFQQNNLNFVDPVNNFPTKILKNENQFLNKKRQEPEIKEDEKIEKNKINTEKPIIKRISTKFIKKPKFILNKKLSQKKNLFTVITKSQYIYRRRKPKMKNVGKNKCLNLKCPHPGCEGIFKTKKQAIFHHFKMSVECQNDTITLLKLIHQIKKIFFGEMNHFKDEKEKEEKIKLFNKYSLLYKEAMKIISLDEYIDIITGFNFEDKLIQ